MFDKQGFIEWVKEEFPTTVDNHWNYDLLENIIDYAVEQKDYSKGQLVGFLYKIIPEVTLEEVERFYNNLEREE